MTSLPPGPSASPAVQTAHWLLRPIAFLESCRRRFGGTFSVRFLGFRTPLVMVSDPDTVRALYSEREHGLPVGRTFALRPIMGPRSVLLLEGSEHLERRKVMLPSFHGERMRAYEASVAEIAAREIDSWPLERAFPLHPRGRTPKSFQRRSAIAGRSGRPEARDPAGGCRTRYLATSVSGTHCVNKDDRQAA